MTGEHCLMCQLSQKQFNQKKTKLAYLRPMMTLCALELIIALNKGEATLRRQAGTMVAVSQF